MAGRHRVSRGTSSTRRVAGRHRTGNNPPEAYLWLGAGAVTLGLGAAALGGGAAIAQASDDTVGSSADTSDGPATGSAKTASGDTDSAATDTAKPGAEATKPGKKKSAKDPADPGRGWAKGKAKATDGGDGQADGQAPTKTGSAPADDAAALKVVKTERVSKAKQAKAEPGDERTTDNAADAGAADSAASAQPADPKTEAVMLVDVDASPTARAATGTTASASGDELAAALNSLLKQLVAKLFNKTPTATVTGPEDQADGTYTGQVKGSDADNDPLTYAILTAATKGTVTVDSSGKYIYTPSADVLATGGSDSFTIQVAEANAYSHIHGLLEIAAWGYAKVENSPFGDPTSYSRVNKTVTVVIATPAVALTPSPGSTDSLVAALFSAPESTDPEQYARSLATTTAAAVSTTAANPLEDFLRKLVSTFFNKTPTATVTGPDEQANGTYTGQVVGADADGDPLGYTRIDSPAHGTVTMDADGNYSYTPDADILATGGTVSFKVEVQEMNAGSHIHGFGELLARAFYPSENFPNPASYSRTYATVTITVAAPVAQLFSASEAADREARVATLAAAAPSSAAGDQLAAALNAALKQLVSKLFNKTPTATVIGPADADDGTYTGQVVGNDADGDPLSYYIEKQPAQGTLSVSAAGNSTFNYTYTPGPELAVAGGTDTFTIQVFESNAFTHYHGLLEILAWGFGKLLPQGVPDPASFSRVNKTITVTAVVPAPSGDDGGTLRFTVSIPEAAEPSALV